MRLRRVKTAAFNEVWIFRDHLINVHSGVALEEKRNVQQ